MLARLALIDGEARPNAVDLKPDQPISIGRSRDNNIVLPRDEQASRLHARVFFEQGRWLIRDFGLNGIRLDQSRVNQVAELKNGNEIQIGFVRFRFSLPDESVSLSLKSTRVSPAAATTPGEAPPYPSNKLDTKNLAALVQLMMAAVDGKDAADLARLIVHNAYYHTGASFSGFFSLDASAPLAKAVWPENTTVDESLARLLTRRLMRDTKTVWLAEDTATLATMSLPNGVQDAFCLPIRTGGNSGETLAALHLSKTGGYFSEKDRLYVEAIAGFAGPLLAGLRHRLSLQCDNRNALGQMDELLGDSPAMVALRSQLHQFATSSLPVLLRGEPGCDPIVAAREIHRRSPRCGSPFVVIPAQSEPGDHPEAELFGYRKGALPGLDRDSIGRVGDADGGTLYFEDLTALSKETQAGLVKLLKARSFQPKGSTHPVRGDVRIIAFCRVDPESAVRAGFDPELAEAFQKHVALIPPLRDRVQDIPFLAQYYLDRMEGDVDRLPDMTPAAGAELQKFPWPGNVRQLRSIIEAAATGGQPEIDASLIRRLLG
jgi:two-component system, NtrC family, response regulator HydG